MTLINPFIFAPVTTYSAAVLADSPRAYLRLGEAGGAGTAADASGNGRTGTYVNTPNLGVTGALASSANTAAEFRSAQSEHVTWDSGAVWSLGIFSVEFWIKATAPGANQLIWGEHRSTLTAPFFHFQASTAGKLVVQQRDDGSTVRLNYTSTASVADGAWHHVVYTETTGGVWELYIDTVLDGSGTYTRAATTLDRCTIAARRHTSIDLYLDGTLDEVAVYGTALSSGRVGAHYAAA